jgi:hypothetical protein
VNALGIFLSLDAKKIDDIFLSVIYAPKNLWLTGYISDLNRIPTRPSDRRWPA